MEISQNCCFRKAEFTKIMQIVKYLTKTVKTVKVHRV